MTMWFLGYLIAMVVQAEAFVLPPLPTIFRSTRYPACCHHATPLQSATKSEMGQVPAELENIPIPFVDVPGNSFIECFADAVANVNGVEYTIGVPCDYSVAICYFDENGTLVPVELDDELMDDVFPIAEGIVAEEFGEELALQRTPQTLTLVGELEDEDDEEMGFEEDNDLSVDDDSTDEEEVEILLSFEHRGT